MMLKIEQSKQQPTINPRDRIKPALGSQPKYINTFQDLRFISVSTSALQQAVQTLGPQVEVNQESYSVSYSSEDSFSA